MWFYGFPDYCVCNVSGFVDVRFSYSCVASDPLTFKQKKISLCFATSAEQCVQQPVRVRSVAQDETGFFRNPVPWY